MSFIDEIDRLSSDAITHFFLLIFFFDYENIIMIRKTKLSLKWKSR